MLKIYFQFSTSISTFSREQFRIPNEYNKLQQIRESYTTVTTSQTLLILCYTNLNSQSCVFFTPISKIVHTIALLKHGALSIPYHYDSLADAIRLIHLPTVANSIVVSLQNAFQET